MPFVLPRRSLNDGMVQQPHAETLPMLVFNDQAVPVIADGKAGDENVLCVLLLTGLRLPGKPPPTTAPYRLLPRSPI